MFLGVVIDKLKLYEFLNHCVGEKKFWVVGMLNNPTLALKISS